MKRILLVSILFVVIAGPIASIEDASSITFSGSAADSLGTPVSEATVQWTENPSVNTTTDINGAFILTGLPSGSVFSVNITKTGFVPLYSQNFDVTANFSSPGHFTLITPTQLASWGVLAGKGAITGRVVEGVNEGSFISGAVVTYSSQLHPGTSPYSVTYYNGTIFEGSSTFSNGLFFILNVDPSDSINVTAAKASWTFNNKIFGTHADAVNAGRIESTHAFIYLPLIIKATPNTLVGTWNKVSCSGSCSGVPDQLVFNANGTGSGSGTDPDANGTFTWTLSGNQLTITSDKTEVANISWIDNNNISLTVIGGNDVTITLKRT
jgi:hypothetical protein